MKHLIALTLISVTSMTSMVSMAHESDYRCGLMVSDTPKALMPAAMKLEGSYALTDEQKQKVQSIGIASGPKVHELVDQIEKLDKAILKAVVKEGKSLADVTSQLDELQQLRRKATEMKLNALHQLSQTVSKEQYERILTLSGWKTQ